MCALKLNYVFRAQNTENSLHLGLVAMECGVGGMECVFNRAHSFQEVSIIVDRVARLVLSVSITSRQIKHAPQNEHGHNVNV